MGDEVRAEPEKLVRLAKTTLGNADGMTSAWSSAQGAVTPAGSAFGNTLEGGQCAVVAAEAVAAMDDTWRQVVGVYEGDVDRLYRVAFAYQQADREAAERLRKGPGMRRAI
ncbi:MAG TPA: type VII secretion target [Pilimelia sp.]|nr:type VII secretion target [Pilimelia sp.]